VARRALLAIGLDSNIPHFVQVGSVPVFRGAGSSDLVCRCGASVLIQGYLPGNFLAIRIKCFRCGAVSTTPGLPEGEILPRDAITVMGYQPAEPQETLGPKLMKEYEVKDARTLTSCNTCHR